MKKLVVVFPVVLALLCCGCPDSPRHSVPQSSSTGRAARAGKGVELYSWRQDGTWLFALLPGTNRAKPEGMVKAAPLKLPELEKSFAGYAEGENIIWVVETGFERPEPSIIRQVELAAQTSRVNLAVP